MRKIRQVLRIKYETQLSNRKIAESLGISRDAVMDYIKRASAANLSWPLPEGLGDDKLEALLFPITENKNVLCRPRPEYSHIHQEMKRDGATLTVLHGEYLDAYPNGIGYSRFTDGYAFFKKKLKPSLRKIYQAGEFTFVDYAGIKNTTKYININGRPAEIFVGVLGASNYIYAEAHWTQKLPDWIAAHVRMFEFFGGVTTILVCDNLKSAVSKASRKDPIIHEVYQNFADHYNVVVIPARPYKPKDKAKVENSVLIVKRWILFRLRKRVFTSLGELNDAIKELLVDTNNRPFKKLPGSRRSAYESIDLPALKPLPTSKFVYAEFHRVRVSLEYYIVVDGYYFTVPHDLILSEVDLRITANIVEVLHKGRRVASHVRDPNLRVTINKAHLPKSHLQVMFFNPKDTLERAELIGEHVYQFTESVLKTFRHSIQGYRFNLLLKDLESRYGAERLNAASLRLIQISEGKLSSNSTSSLSSILQKGLDLQAVQDNEPVEASFDHDNIRGSGYYK
jgi:transposase